MGIKVEEERRSMMSVGFHMLFFEKETPETFYNKKKFFFKLLNLINVFFFFFFLWFFIYSRVPLLMVNEKFAEAVMKDFIKID